MNQDSSINSITKAQNIKQAIIDTDVPPTSKENAKNKPDIEYEGNTICRKSTEQHQPNENPKSKRDSKNIRTQHDQTHKWMGNSEKMETRMQTFFEKLPRSNYSMYG